MTEPTNKLVLDPAAVEPVQDLAVIVAEVVTTTPGVLRLEPTLNNALRRLAPARLAVTTPSPTFAGSEGVVIHHRHGTTNVTVDIAVSAPPTAVEVAVDVESRIREALEQQGPSNLVVAVNVLSSEVSTP